jgi:hypothetical protein
VNDASVIRLMDSLALFIVPPYLHTRKLGENVTLAKNPQTKDDALEALDFIVNVLKEHEHDLDRLINELATVTEQIGETGGLNGKVEQVEEKINKLQCEGTNLIGYLSTPPKETSVTAAKNQTTQDQQAQTTTVPPLSFTQVGVSLVLQCKQWQDFQNLAKNAPTISFSYKEDENVFQVDALKENKIVSYSGPLPEFSALLKSLLSKQLDVAENNILEGTLKKS